MVRILLICFSFVTLAACDPARLSTAQGPEPGANACQSRGAERCVFLNGPVRLQSQPIKLPPRRALFYPMAAPLDFVDGGQSRWEAPAGTLTDGASIPPMFIKIVGNPTSRHFAQAAAVHDAYCGIGNEAGPNYHARPWPQVHRMFYDALRVGGTPERKAKLMFAAVWLGGPRWGIWDRGLLDVPVAQKQDILRRAQALIARDNPTVDELVDYLSKQESAAIAAARDTVHGGGMHDGYDGYVGGDPSVSEDPSSPGEDPSVSDDPAMSDDPSVTL